MSDRQGVPKLVCEYSTVVFVNSVAGGSRARTFLPRIQKVFESLGVRAEFVLTRSAEELEASARNSILQGRNLLLAMGGDGTFQPLANAAFGADVVLGVIPVGGGNDLAAALGIPKDPIKAAQAVLCGQPRFVDLARARTGDGRIRFYAGGGGIGLDAEAARHSNGAHRHLPGRLRYISSALRALATFDFVKVRIEFSGSDLAPFESKALVAAVLNSPTYGAGLRLAPGAAIDDGLLDVVLIEELTKFEVLRLLPRLTGSGELRTTRVKRWRAPRVRFMTEQLYMFHGDGEILGPTPVNIEVVAQAVRVLAPVRS